MSWRDGFKHSFDLAYKLTKGKYGDAAFPCYGGRFYWFLASRHFDNFYFYLTKSSFIYTTSGVYFTEIPFEKMKKVTVRRGLFFKSSFHIRIVADKKYHLLIKVMKNFSTQLTGNSTDNVRQFIETLESQLK